VLCAFGYLLSFIWTLTFFFFFFFFFFFPFSIFFFFFFFFFFYFFFLFCFFVFFFFFFWAFSFFFFFFLLLFSLAKYFSFIYLFIYSIFVGPWGTDYYRIWSNFWKFYLIETSFTFGELVFLVKVFRLFRLKRIFLGVESVNTVGRCITFYILVKANMLVMPWFFFFLIL